jgi:palmitoyl transferase
MRVFRIVQQAPEKKYRTMKHIVQRLTTRSFSSSSSPTIISATRFCTRALAALACTAALLPAAHAEDGSLWQDTKSHLGNIWDQGDDAIYLSGIAHHGRSTYTKEKLNELNEHAWGLGYGRTLRNARGDDESLYGFVLKDSHRHPQYMAGYAYEWIFPVARTGLEVGIGGTAMLMSRQDYLGGVPFPVPLPLASIGTSKAKVMFAYVPRLSSNKNNGDVLLIFGRIEM